MPWSPIEVHRCFGGQYSLYFQGRRIIQVRNQDPVDYFLLVFWLVYYSFTLKMEAVLSSEKSVDLHRTIWRYIQEDDSILVHSFHYGHLRWRFLSCGMSRLRECRMLPTFRRNILYSISRIGATLNMQKTGPFETLETFYHTIRRHFYSYALKTEATCSSESLVTCPTSQKTGIIILRISNFGPVVFILHLCRLPLPTYPCFREFAGTISSLLQNNIYVIPQRLLSL
jgi:hypothetical protein